MTKQMNEKDLRLTDGNVVITLADIFGYFAPLEEKPFHHCTKREKEIFHAQPKTLNYPLFHPEIDGGVTHYITSFLGYADNHPDFKYTYEDVVRLLDTRTEQHTWRLRGDDNTEVTTQLLYTAYKHNIDLTEGKHKLTPEVLMLVLEAMNMTRIRAIVKRRKVLNEKEKEKNKGMHETIAYLNKEYQENNKTYDQR